MHLIITNESERGGKPNDFSVFRWHLDYRRKIGPRIRSNVDLPWVYQHRRWCRSKRRSYEVRKWKRRSLKERCILLSPIGRHFAQFARRMSLKRRFRPARSKVFEDAEWGHADVAPSVWSKVLKLLGGVYKFWSENDEEEKPPEPTESMLTAIPPLRNSDDTVVLAQLEREFGQATLDEVNQVNRRLSPEMFRLRNRVIQRTAELQRVRFISEDDTRATELPEEELDRINPTRVGSTAGDYIPPRDFYADDWPPWKAGNARIVHFSTGTSALHTQDATYVSRPACIQDLILWNHQSICVTPKDCDLSDYECVYVASSRRLLWKEVEALW